MEMDANSYGFYRDQMEPIERGIADAIGFVRHGDPATAIELLSNTLAKATVIRVALGVLAIEEAN